jgi:SAM-dependent methyltransferase
MDPFWAVLSHPEKEGKLWDPDDFFKTGVDEIRGVMNEVTRQGVVLGADRALDFGCGPGRLSQALVAYFKRVDGVDIAPSMIELANKFNRHPEQCHFHVNARDDLTIFEDGAFNFVYSNITLQHMEPLYARAYIREFIRVLQPGGALVFQLPGRLVKIPARIKRLVPQSMRTQYLRLLKKNHPARDVYGMPRNEVLAFGSSLGAELVGSTRNADAGGNWESFRYTWRRRT